MRLFSNKLIKAIAIIIVLGLVLEFISRTVVDWLWFQEVGYLSVWLKQRQTQIILSLIVFIPSALFFWGNLSLAEKQGWQWIYRSGWVKNTVPYLSGTQRKLPKFANSATVQKNIGNRQKYFAIRQPIIRLPLLFLLIVFATSSLSLLLGCYGKLIFQLWNRQAGLNITLVDFIQVISPNNADLVNHLGLIFCLVLGISIWILTNTKFALRAIAVLFTILLSALVASNWIQVLAYLQPTSFDYSDPQFGRDISFYIFDLPVLNLISLWLLGLMATSLIIVFLYYLLSGNSFSEGKFPGFSSWQLRHLLFLSGLALIAMAMHHWLNRYQLLYSQQGVSYGGGFKEVNLQLPVETGLSIVAVVIAIWFVWQSISSNFRVDHNSVLPSKGKTNFIEHHALLFPEFNLKVLFPLSIYVVLLLSGQLASNLVQRFRVQPNELALEKPYLTRSINLTRKAFNLDAIEAQTFNPQGQLTASDLAQNDLTLDNVRIWDTRPILKTNRQLQQIRLYYEFLDADIDRYIFNSDQGKNKQQVIITARELDYESVPDRAKTWVNKHLIYTHGYGFTLSPVNRTDAGGLPFYYVKDIGATTSDTGGLTVSDQTIRDSLPLENPRIYYGEMTNNYIMTKTKVQELDFPSGEENVYNIYDGKGGIQIKNYGLRLLFAEYLKDWQMLFTNNFKTDTKLLLRRNISSRVAKIAPWLRYDSDPYLVTADTSTSDRQKDHHLYWIIDAYTISDRYPYSDPGSNEFNYIRNSVKVVVDAYNGDVSFYVADSQDPIIHTWRKVFPNLFKSLEAMPPSLRSHIRYPEDLFSIQSESLLTYHMTDAQVFYNREDQWQIPKEIYASESQPVKPYYLIMKLPTAKEEEFILLHPYTPTSRPNLIAWLAARSDGENYGKLLLYKFPKQKLVYGPNQIEALINQDPIISQQISLWNREGSRATQGNLLIIPIEQSLLYVEPLYIEAEENSLPTLARVIVVYENQIVMAENLDKAIAAIFKPTQKDEDTIVRPVESSSVESIN